jgi:hypothetical protein
VWAVLLRQDVLLVVNLFSLIFLSVLLSISTLFLILLMYLFGKWRCFGSVFVACSPFLPLNLCAVGVDIPWCFVIPSLYYPRVSLWILFLSLILEQGCDFGISLRPFLGICRLVWSMVV